MRSFETYPRGLESLEAEAIHRRRNLFREGHADAPESLSAARAAPSSPQDGGPSLEGNEEAGLRLPPDTVGLAFSGGGIRSATFCVGFLQALAKRRLLREIDWLSTVSGGGYAGAFLGRFYDRLRQTPGLAADIVEDAVANPATRAIRWLRAHGQYIAPAGRSDLTLGFAVVLRNLLTLYFILGLLVFGLYGLANGIRYGLLERVGAILPYVTGFSWSDMPLGYLVFRGNLGHFWSPWFMLVELVVLLLALPNAIGYWLASQDEPEGYNRPALLVAFLLIVGLLWASVNDGFNVTALLAAAPILLAFAAVEWAWHNVRRDNAAAGTGGPKVEQLRARTRLSRELAMWLGITGVLLYLAVIDTIGHAIYEAYGRRNVGFAAALAQLGAGLLAGMPVLRMFARAIANRQSQEGGGENGDGLPSSVIRQPVVSAILSVLLMAPPLLVVSYACHATFAGGDPAALRRGWIAAGVALVLSAIFATRWAMPFVNRSSLQATYAARLARAYLGASNPTRRRTASDDVVPNDDVECLTDYKPFEAGGPFHLINVCVNQTVDEQTLRTARDRRGMNMACSSIGVSMDRFFHARWVPAVPPAKAPSPKGATRSADDKQNYTIKAIGHVPGTAHPLLGVDGQPPDTVNVLPLRDWVSISGAAFGPGMGKSTNAAMSVLFTLANLRTGYWWNSGLTSGDRGTRPQVSFVRRVLWLLPHLFQTQTRLLDEAFARFAGPWERFWYLSDGGHFENLGGYELIRRKVPFIIMLDAGADAGYAFDDLANFQRRIRVDFQAEIQPLGMEQWDRAIERDVQAQNGEGEVAKRRWQALAEYVAVGAGDGGPCDHLLASPADGRQGPVVRKHATVFRIVYPDRRSSLVLYVKASLSGDEPPDVQQYRIDHPDFPHESTADQFFGEAQWESYRRLGEHIGDAVLGPVEPAAGASGLWLTRL